MDKRKVTIGKFLLFFIILLYGFVCILPIFELSIVRLIQVVAIGVLFLYMLSHINENKNLSKIGLGLIGFYSMILLYWSLGYSTASVGNYFNQISFFISIIAAYFCLKRLPYSYNVAIYFLFTMSFLYRFINDIVIGRRDQDYTLLELQEMGSTAIQTQFNSATLLILCISLLIALNNKRIIIKFIGIAFFIVSFYYIVFVGQRGSVFILMLISIVLILYERKYGRVRVSSGIRYTLLLLLGVFFYAFLADYFISFLIEYSPSQRLTDRLVDIQGTTAYGISDESFSGRLSLELVSLESWRSSIFSFFFGIGDHRFNSEEWGIQGFVMSGIGGHSELIDSLARYGVLGFSIISYLYYNICKYITSLFDNYNVDSQVKIILIISLLISLTKGLLFPEIGLTLFFLLPLSSIFFIKSQQSL